MILLTSCLKGTRSGSMTLVISSGNLFHNTMDRGKKRTDSNLQKHESVIRKRVHVTSGLQGTLKI